MSAGLKKTFETLSASDNEASVPVLLWALNLPHGEIQEGALRAILDRRSLTGQREVIRRMHQISERWRQIIDEHRGRMTQALRNAVLDSDDQMCRNGCQAILWFREYDLIPTLVNACEDDANPHAELAAQTLLSLTDLLYEELSGTPDYRPRRDPQLVRRNIAVSLEESVKRFPKHKRREPIEAFLQLAGRDNSTLMQILCDPRHSSYMSVIQMLTHSTRPSIMRLILSYLDSPQAPSALVNVMVHRTDRRFIDNLLRRVGREPSAAARGNLKHASSIAWLRDSLEILEQFDDAAQHSALQLVLATSMRSTEAFTIIKYLLQNGAPGGRRAAIEALSPIGGADANQLVQQCADDADPQVQAAALSQFRQRGITGALATLIAKLDSPHSVVRKAVQQNLVEFSFARYLSAFDTLAEDVRRSTGMLVCRVDPQSFALLQQELTSSQGKRRLRALAMARYMRACEQVETVVRELLLDTDRLVRAEACRTLGECRTATARDALGIAAQDNSVTVREAAQAALDNIGTLSASVPPLHTPTINLESTPVS